MAHPDDIEFGAAGAVAAWTAGGKIVTYLLLSRGEEYGGTVSLTRWGSVLVSGENDNPHNRMVTETTLGHPFTPRGLAGRGGAAPVTTVFDAVRASLIEVVADLDPGEDIAGRGLADLGCNSIDRAEVVTLAMERLGIVVPIAEFRDVNNVDAIVDLLRKHV